MRIPVSSPVTSAFPKVPVGRRTTIFRSTTSEREVLRGCSHSIMFRPPSLLPPRSFPPLASNFGCRGSRGVYVRAERGSLPPRGRVGDWRAGLGRSLCSLLPRPFGCEVSQHRDRAYVSSLRHVERSVWISLTTLTCLLRITGYGTYPAGATFGGGRRTL